ncbi:MAG: AgmX/PglI C-terminal domain-containing protein [Pseudobdellovibrionaceae bacterium]
MKSPIILRIFKGQQLIEVKQFDRDQVIFGHDAEVQLELNDESVSPIHCLIELRDSGYYLCDLGSATGTRKNGKPILDEPLSSGEYIEVGPFRIQFFVGVPKPKEAPQTAATIVVKPTAEPSPQMKPEPAPVVVKPPVVAPAAPRIPDQKAGSSKAHKKSKHEKTFAPPSEIRNLRDHLRPTKGPVIEVIVAWQERVLTTSHFTSEEVITIGSDSKADIQIPSQFLRGLQPFIETKGGTRVLAGIEMQAEVVNSAQQILTQEELLRVGKATRAGSGVAIRLDQGEIVCLSIAQGTVQIFVRNVAAANKPLMAPPLDLTSGELTGLVVALMIVALTALYMSVYNPPEVAEEEQEEVVRLAEFVYNKPPTPVIEQPQPTPEPTKQEVEQKTPPTTVPVRVQVTDKEKQAVAKGQKDSMNAVRETEAAKAAEVRPRPSKVDRPKKFTSVKQGGATKVGETAGANAQSKDVNNEGLLAAFGGGGIRKQLDQAYSGSGELLGMANEASGRTGQNESRPGEDIGSKFKDTGAGGKGTATQGIAGVGTKGRASGMSTYGGGVGLGGKGSVTIIPGGADEGWVGSIDREAVRRVIRSILNQIKSCYERQLRVNSTLEGKVIIQFEIAEQGRVRTAKTKSTSLNDSTVESCVASRIREARFPEPPSGTIAVVDFPFVFGAQK